MGVPGSDEGGAGHPAADRQKGTGEQQESRPADEDESIALEPVVEDVKPPPIGLRSSHCYGHFKTSLYDIDDSSRHKSSVLYLREDLTFLYDRDI